MTTIVAIRNGRRLEFKQGINDALTFKRPALASVPYLRGWIRGRKRLSLAERLLCGFR